MNKKFNVGIDLGTTNSVLCVYNEVYSRPDVLKIYGKSGITPSVIYYDEDNKSFIIGDEAKEQADYYAKSFAFMKTKMSDGDKKIETKNNYEMSPVDFSSKILAYLYEGFLSYFGEEAQIENLVVTVPAYFKDKERKSTLSAIKKANIKVLNETRLINEPTAAALAYGDDLNNSNKIITYDLGGGTFDVTLLEIDKLDEVKIFQAIKTDGKTLGGCDFDKLLINELIKLLNNNEKIESKKEIIFLENSLKGEAEKIKIALSKLDKVTGTCIAFGIDKKYLIDYTFKREDFEAMINSYIDSTIEMTKKTIGDDKVTDFVLVGGSTRIPLIEEKLLDEFGQINIVKVDPDLIVASGAAIQAGIMARKKDSILNEILSGGNIGISVRGDFVSYLVMEGTPIPFTISDRFQTSAGGSSSVKTYIVQGKDLVLESPNNLILGELVLDNLVVIQSTSIIDIKINVNNSGEVEVIANEVAKGGSTAVKLVDISKHEDTKVSLLDFKKIGDSILLNKDKESLIIEARRIVNLLERSNNLHLESEVKLWFLKEFDNALLMENTDKLISLIARANMMELI